MTRKSKARLTLGPLLFNWPAEHVRSFYARIAREAPVETVCLGEVVCPKRAPLLAAALADAAECLLAAGKEVVQSTLAMVLDERDMASVTAITGEAIAGSSDFPVEANDMAAIAALQGRPHIVGPYINVYNEGTLRCLARGGATRVCLTPELGREAIVPLAATGAAELEVQVFGRLPLALSARCYHARAHGLHRDNCRYVCAGDTDGMAVETLAGEPFLAINGIQTLSSAYCSLLDELRDLQSIGVHHFRLSPHDTDMVAVARLFRAVLDRRTSAGAAQAKLAALLPEATFCNGYYHQRAGLAKVETEAA